MKMRIKTVLLGASLLSGSLLFAQNPSLPSVEMLGGEYFCYTVEDGDSAFGVAKRYGWDYDELCRLNPDVVKNMKRGAMLYYPTGRDPKAAAVIPDETLEYKVISHVVRKGDTVYSIAAKYGISIETLYANHPSARNGIKEGETLIINRSGTSAQPAVAARQESTSAASEQPVTQNTAQTEPAVAAPAAATPTPAPTPASDASVDIASVLGNGTLSNSDINLERVANIAVVLDNPALQRDREFMRGFLIALQDMENSGMKVKLTAVDASKGSESVISTLNSISPQLVVLVHDKNIPEWIVNYGNSKPVQLLNVFDVKYAGTDSNPSMMQLLAPSKVFNEAIADFAASNFADSKLMFVNEPAASDGIAEELRKRWNQSNTIVVPCDNLLDKKLGEDTKYLFYINSTDKDEIKKALDKIAELRSQTPMASVKVFGRPSWVTLAQTLSEDFSKNDVHIPSRFYFDWNTPKAQEFVKSYEMLYHRRPALTFPIFALSGYDVAQCFIPSVAANGGDFSKGMLRGDTLQSDFVMEKTSDNGGYINKGVFLVRFTPFGTVEKMIAQ